MECAVDSGASNIFCTERIPRIFDGECVNFQQSNFIWLGRQGFPKTVEAKQTFSRWTAQGGAVAETAMKLTGSKDLLISAANLETNAT